MAEPRRWLLIAHSFNMDGRAASQTVTDKIPHLLAQGIELTVISATTGRRDDRFEHYQLLPWGPSGLRFDFRHLVAKRFGRGVIYRLVTLLASIVLLPLIIIERLVFGLTHHSSWTLPAAHLGTKLVREKPFELVFSSGGAWSAHMAAALIKRKTGIQWIAEIHDPMVIRDNPEDTGVAPREDRNTRYLQKVEGVICREADDVWWFTEPALAYAKLRYPELGDRGFVVYPGAEPPEVKGNYQRGSTLNLCHFGSLTNDRSLAPVLSALSTLIETNPELCQEIRVHLYGSALDDSAKAVLDHSQLSSMVVEHGRLEYDPVSGLSGRAQVTKKMFEADVLLLLHGDYEWCAEYIPSKYYEYLWAGRPILALTNRSESFDELLRSRNAYIAHTLEPVTIEEQILKIWNDWKLQQLKQPQGEALTVAEAVTQIVERVS